MRTQHLLFGTFLALGGTGLALAPVTASAFFNPFNMFNNDNDRYDRYDRYWDGPYYGRHGGPWGGYGGPWGGYGPGWGGYGPNWYGPGWGGYGPNWYNNNDNNTKSEPPRLPE